MKNENILLFFTIALLGVSSVVFSFRFSEEVRLNQNDPFDGKCWNLQICSDDQGNVYACWMDDRDTPHRSDIYFRHGVLQANGDISWDNEQKIGDIADCWDPRIVCDDAGHVYVAWIVREDSGGQVVYFNRSDNYGQTWKYTTGLDLNDPVGPGILRLSVSIACDSKGHVYAVWEDDRSSSNRSKIYFDYSEDFGKTWHTDKLLGRFANIDGYYPKVSCDEQGNIYVVWFDGNFPGNAAYFNRSSDYGITWNQFDTPIGDSYASKNGPPHIVNNGYGKVYVAWLDRREGDFRVYINYSHDSGITWLAEDIEINDPEDHIASDSLALRCEQGEGAGHVYLAWGDWRSGVRADVYFDYSENSGVTWHKDTKLNFEVSYYGSANVDMDNDGKGHIYVVWMDPRTTSTAAEIWTNFSTDYGKTWLLGDQRVDAGDVSAGFPKVSAIRKNEFPYACFVWKKGGTKADAYSNSIRVNDGGIAVSPGPGEQNRPYVRIFDGEGARLGEDFLAYNTTDYGAEIASGEKGNSLDGVLVTGPGPGTGYGPNVRGYDMAGDGAQGLNFLAYGISKYGANVGVGELDYDDFGEILTGPGPGEMFGPHVRIWSYDGTKVTPLGSGFFAYGVRKFGVKVSSGDIDGDGKDEIITAPGPGPMFGAHVKCWKYEGGTVHQIAGFMAYSTGKYGVNIGGGNVDGDDRDEILTGPGPSPAYGSHVRGWRYENGVIEDIPGINFKAYNTKGFGCKVTGGDTDFDAIDEFVTLPGPGPAFPAHLRGFAFEEGQVVPIAALNFFAFDSAEYKYGGNAAVFELSTER